MAKKPAAKKKAKSNLDYAKPKPKKAKVVKVTVKKSPRQPSLPTMEDRAIDELENFARDVKDVDKQMAELRTLRKGHLDDLIAAMRRMGRSAYHHDGITITLKDDTKANVKVKPAKEESPDESPEVEVA